MNAPRADWLRAILDSLHSLLHSSTPANRIARITGGRWLASRSATRPGCDAIYSTRIHGNLGGRFCTANSASKLAGEAIVFLAESLGTADVWDGDSAHPIRGATARGSGRISAGTVTALRCYWRRAPLCVRPWMRGRAVGWKTRHGAERSSPSSSERPPVTD
jgi:hypothetical protein